MRRTIFLCVGNVLLFSFFGLAFLFPFSAFTPMEYGYGFQARLTIFPLLLVAYLIIYPLTCHILGKRYRWGKGAGSELSCEDEREDVIVAASTKVAYQSLIGGLLVLIPAIGGVRFFSLFTGIEISIYATAIALLTVLLIVATVLYCVTWCRSYLR